MKRIGRWILAALAIALLIGAALAENAGEALPGRTGEATAVSPTQAGDAAPSEAQSQILCKLPTRREQSRIQCVRQRIYPTAALCAV